MTRKYGTGLLAFVLAIFAVAFTIKPKSAKPKKAYTIYYYRYDGTSFGEGDFEDPNNWVALGSTAPGTDPCPIPPDNNVCVLSPSMTTGTGTVGDLISFLQAQAPAGSGATSYCTNSLNIPFYKP